MLYAWKRLEWRWYESRTLEAVRRQLSPDEARIMSVHVRLASGDLEIVGSVWAANSYLFSIEYDATPLKLSQGNTTATPHGSAE